ncbi:hypothetical protein [Dactylosporangium darangshiense]|uniref:hypothetical protein n=1 Tax=Dactylosporangium darangshiense TaxID=579108 RepID=UPI00363B70F3
MTNRTAHLSCNARSTRIIRELDATRTVCAAVPHLTINLTISNDHDSLARAALDPVDLVILEGHAYDTDDRGPRLGSLPLTYLRRLGTIRAHGVVLGCCWARPHHSSRPCVPALPDQLRYSPVPTSLATPTPNRSTPRCCAW